jgi:hypothetical protein
MAVELVIQGAVAGGQYLTCWQQDEPTLDVSTRVSVLGDDRSLVDAMVTALIQRVSRPGCSSCQGPTTKRLGDCRAAAARSPGVAQHLVVVVGRPASGQLDHEAAAFLHQRGAVAVGVHLGGAADLPRRVWRFQAINAAGGPADAAEDVLHAVGLGLDERRAFLSYAHDDQAMAIDLAEALQKRRFRVFLDAHGISAGAVWQDVLKDEIVEAGLVVVLDSIPARRSKWVSWELSFARHNGAAVVKIVVPNVRVAGTVPWFRLGTFDDAAEFATRQHREQLGRMRNRDLADLECELLSMGCQPTINGSFVETSSGVAVVDPRPGTARHFRRADERRIEAGLSHSLVVSPRPILRMRRQDQDFLARTGIERISSGALPLAARSLI